MEHKRTYKIQTASLAMEVDFTNLINDSCVAIQNTYVSEGKILAQGVTYDETDPNIMNAWVTFDTEANCIAYYDALTAASNVETDKVGLTIIDETNETV